MHRYCISLAFLFAVTLGFQLEEFAEITSYDGMMDMLLDKMKSSLPSNTVCPPLNLAVSLTGGNSSSPAGSFAGPSCIVGDFSTVQRNSPVISQLAAGNLTLSTTFTFKKLIVQYPQSSMQVVGQNFEISASVIVVNNEFKITFTIFTKEGGKCAVDLTEAIFTAISDIAINFTPLGFFNQFQLNAKINYLVKDFLDQFKDTNVAFLQSHLESELCSLVSP